MLIQTLRAESPELREEWIHVDQCSQAAETKFGQPARAAYIQEQIRMPKHILRGKPIHTFYFSGVAIHVANRNSHVTTGHEVLKDSQPGLRVVAVGVSDWIVTRSRPPAFLKIENLMAETMQAQKVMESKPAGFLQLDVGPCSHKQRCVPLQTHSNDQVLNDSLIREIFPRDFVAAVQFAS